MSKAYGSHCDTWRCAAKQDRHWFTCHLINELKRIECNELMMMNAKIITTEARMRVATEYKTRCPFKFCKLTRSTGFFVREDTLARHVVHCAAKQGLDVHRDWALRWALGEYGGASYFGVV
jgi:hypothetical protein